MDNFEVYHSKNSVRDFWNLEIFGDFLGIFGDFLGIFFEMFCFLIGVYII